MSTEGLAKRLKLLRKLTKKIEKPAKEQNLALEEKQYAVW